MEKLQLHTHCTQPQRHFYNHLYICIHVRMYIKKKERKRKTYQNSERNRLGLDRALLSVHAETSVLQFFGDDFLRLLLVRYVFCDVVLNLHRSFRGRQQRPRCHPPLPDAEVLEHPTLHHLVLDLAACLDCRDHFPDSNELAWPRHLSCPAPHESTSLLPPYSHDYDYDYCNYNCNNKIVTLRPH